MGSAIGAWGATVIGLVQVASALARVELYPCPFVTYLRFECPGCGLSRSSAAMFHGDLLAMLRLHPFAPLFMVALVCAVVGALLPSRQRRAWGEWITSVERTIPIAPTALLLLIAYWLFKSVARIV